jgi:hypothetical protein
MNRKVEKKYPFSLCILVFIVPLWHFFNQKDISSVKISQSSYCFVQPQVEKVAGIVCIIFLYKFALDFEQGYTRKIKIK